MESDNLVSIRSDLRKDLPARCACVWFTFHDIYSRARILGMNKIIRMTCYRVGASRRDLPIGRSSLLPVLLCLGFSAVAFLPASANVFTVTNVDDSGTGSLRQAMLDANANPGADTIQFAIAAAPPVTIQPGSALPVMLGPVTIDGATQPGYVDHPLIEVDCRNIAPPSSALVLSGGNSTVRGLVLNRYTSAGIELNTVGGNLVEGCYVGTVADGSAGVGRMQYGIRILRCGYNVIGGSTAQAKNVIGGGPGGMAIHVSDNYDTRFNTIAGNHIGVSADGTTAIPTLWGIILYRSGDNVIGGTLPGERNIISGCGMVGILINDYGSSRNTVIGNYIGTDAAGTSAIPNLWGIQLGGGAQSNTIGGTDPARRNLISGNTYHGIRQMDTKGNGNFFQGNWIGTDSTGVHALPNGKNGISIEYSYSHTIGGTQPGAGNVISGNGWEGIYLVGAASTSIKIQGNYIGTTPGGTPLGNGASGIALNDHASYNLIGGLEPGAGNVIAYNTSSDSWTTGGIFITMEGNRNTILSNSIFANSSLGIELGESGPTLNDLQDLDTGTNNLQNFPVLTEVLGSPAGIQITGLLNSAPNSEFTVQFFWNDACDDSGYGEGQHFIGSTTALTNADGDTSFTVVYHHVTSPEGKWITSTATDSEGNTSEFSQCLAAVSGPVPTQTPTPIPTASPTPSPSATPGDWIDGDGDGYADWYEQLPGVMTDPGDAASHPAFGDVNGDGHATVADALLLYRQATGRIPPGTFPAVDVDYDGDCDANDAIALYWWALRKPGFETLPHTP